MVNEQLLNYVKSQLGQGVSAEKVKADLLSQGWSETDVTQALTGSGSPVVASVIPPVSVATSSQPIAQNPTSVPNRPPKAPTLVIVIAWIMLIFGIFGLLGSGLLTLLGGFGGSAIITLIGIANLLSYILMIAVSFGIRYLRRWAFYVFIVVTVLNIFAAVGLYLFSAKKSLEDIIVAVIAVIILVYFWLIRRSFK